MSRRKQKRLGCFRTVLVVAALGVLAYEAPRIWRASQGDALAQAVTIPGMTAGDFYEDLSKQGFTVMRGGEGEGQRWNCQKSAGGLMYSLKVFGRTSAEIIQVDAAVEGPFDRDVTKEAATYFGQIASRPFPRVEPTAARRWVESNITGDTSTTLGSVQMALKGQQKSSKSLSITGAK